MKQRILEFIKERKSFYLQELLEVLLEEGYTVRESDGKIYDLSARQYLSEFKRKGLIKHSAKRGQNLHNSIIISNFNG